MNYHQAIKNYKDNDILSQVEGGSKHDFIKIILTELSQNLKFYRVQLKMNLRHQKNKSKSLGRIIASLTILMNSLDFEKENK